MSLVVDGYNLLHASGILGRGVGPGSLERSRQTLLNFLAESLSEKELARTTVVFDARDPPPGLPRRTTFRGISVVFAAPGSDADTVIEELIRADSSPRNLTVVSSDHRLHRAARRRRAKAIDSDEWYAAILRARFGRLHGKSAELKRGEPKSEHEVEFWLRQFGMNASEPAATHSPTADETAAYHPFPPGYGDDVVEEESDETH